MTYLNILRRRVENAATAFYAANDSGDKVLADKLFARWLHLRELLDGLVHWRPAKS